MQEMCAPRADELAKAFYYFWFGFLRAVDPWRELFPDYKN